MSLRLGVAEVLVGRLVQRLGVADLLARVFAVVLPHGGRGLWRFLYQFVREGPGRRPCSSSALSLVASFAAGELVSLLDFERSSVFDDEPSSVFAGAAAIVKSLPTCGIFVKTGTPGAFESPV
jgi:hypothetical protein